VVLVVVVVAVAKTTGSVSRGGVSARRVSASWRAIAPRAFLSVGCPIGAVVVAGFYKLGPTFKGLRFSHQALECHRARPRRAISGSRKPVGYAYLTYGTCDYRVEACLNPLEIQTWPECARNPNSYRADEGSTKGEKSPLNPSNSIVLTSEPELPAESFDGGTRLEMYGGRTTVVVFAPEVALAHEAAEALAPVVMDHALPTTVKRLRVEASQPGDASGCHNLLTASS